MKVSVFILILCALIFPLQATAENILPAPICFTIINEAPYGIYGDLSTDQDVYGQDNKNVDVNVTDKITHRATFRLKEGESMPACTTGPLFAGNRIRITLRTLIPVFECKTMIYQGAEIRIHGRRKKDDSGVKTWAECL